MPAIAENLSTIRERIARAAQRAGRRPDDILLIGASKTVDAARIREAFAAGLTHFGENRVQEAEAKLAQLADIRAKTVWSLIGPLQTNKITRTLQLFDAIHSVDSVRLAEAISTRAARDVPVLLEVNIGGEASKSGFPPAELPTACEQARRFPHLRIEGLMTVPPQTLDPEQARPYFQALRRLRDQLGLTHLSMGMTGDFEVAIEEGATMVRIGRALFGERP